MKLIKRQTTNLRSINGPGISYDINDQVILDSQTGMLVPKGTTAERPFYPENGYVRYNSETNEFESYQNSQWRKLRFKEPRAIIQQNLGVGDDTETLFGPLNNGDSDSPAPESAQALLIFVENVFQISTTNYTIVQNPTSGPGQPYAAGWYVNFGTPVPTGKPVTVLHNFDK